MLSTMRSSWLLFALLALVALSAAFSVEDALHIDGINAYLHHGEKRQAQGTGASSSAAPSTTEESSSAEEPSSTAAPPSTVASTSAAQPTSSNDEPSSSDAAATSQTERSSAAAATTTNAATTSKTSSKITTPVVTTKPLVSTEVAPTTTIITIVSDGQSIVQTSVGSMTVEHTTGTATETTLPSTESSGGGLSSTKKSIIGGVVGGVGGAILLGGIALVCWRMWGKKKRVTEDDADLMAGTGSALGDKSHSGASPFQSNLEQYHNPGGRPNAAANF